MKYCKSYRFLVYISKTFHYTYALHFSRNLETNLFQNQFRDEPSLPLALTLGRPRTRQYIGTGRGTSPAGSHVFPTASRSYNGAAATRRRRTKRQQRHCFPLPSHGRVRRPAVRCQYLRTRNATSCSPLALPSCPRGTKMDIQLKNKLTSTCRFDNLTCTTISRRIIRRNC